MARKLRYYSCLYCKKDFSARKMYLKYCSKSCAIKKRISEGFVGRKIIPNMVKCPNCDIEFHVYPSNFKLNKTGIKFCSRKCKSEYMKKGLVILWFQKRKSLQTK